MKASDNSFFIEAFRYDMVDGVVTGEGKDKHGKYTVTGT